MDKKLEKAMTDLKEAEKKINAPNAGVVTPKVMDAVKSAPKQKKEPMSNPEKLREFIKQTNAVYVQNPGTPYEKWYATAPAWGYLAALNNVEVCVLCTYDATDPLDKNATAVFAEGELKDLATGETITNGKMCASTSEDFLKGKPLSAAYGLAQTRLEERLLRMKFGYQLSLARLEPVGAEELDVDPAKYGTKDKEI